MEARNLAVWGFPWQSNPYCRLSLGSQVMRSRKDDATSHRGSHKAPVWNQEFHFLVTDTTTQVASLQQSCCLQDKTVQCLCDVGFGSVDSLANIALCNRHHTFVTFSVPVTAVMCWLKLTTAQRWLCFCARALQYMQATISFVN